MHDATDIVTRLQPRLHGIAYRMLGSVADAEDVVQDVWLRWHDTEQSAVDNPEAWLVTTTTRRAIDRLRSARAAREHYVGIWLPEPILTGSVPTDAPATPEQTHARYGDLSVALLALLERLSPEARAAFLLRDVFDVDYPDIAAALGKNEAACRQIVFRARAQLQDDRPRYRVDADAHRRLLERFVAAMTGGDLDGMKALLAGTSRLLGDGGGIVPSMPEPLVGADRIARLFFARTLRNSESLRVEIVPLNGGWGLLRYFDGVLESAQAYESDGERIHRVYVQRNPHKLARILRQLAGDAGRPAID
ncbi:RNA polymerase sigma-70 factor [Tahibacter soli]|uniref:RNA polymerase sigma-70 factor n=1 Tax=Tahibacter soli TaxID=2983605 RepID=A0A9X4BJC9_9GAMM|nr:RNA polymerase sigma-70 factor [Tahibacter soli]MDC8013122.1 RNA polymerase sigma-70 factor [Tahibacter soli]